jgi:hypothetical protein
MASFGSYVQVRHGATLPESYGPYTTYNRFVRWRQAGIRDHIWWTTQPMEDPERREHLFEVIEWVGWDKLLFATDYPHWDFDDPSRVLPVGVSDANKQSFYLDNAKKLYGLT